MDGPQTFRSGPKSPMPPITNKLNTSIKKEITALDRVAKQAIINAERMKSPSNLMAVKSPRNLPIRLIDY